VQKSAAPIAGVPEAHGLDPPFEFKEKLLWSDKTISVTCKESEPLFLILACKGEAILFVVTTPKS
jgi:hypothetical protein